MRLRTPAGHALALAAALGGCTVGPNYRTPPVLAGGPPPVPPLLGAYGTAYDQIAPLPDRWWHLYDDPVFDALVTKALVYNADVRMALANLEEARAVLRGDQAKRTPQTSLSGVSTYGGGRAHISGSIDGYAVSGATTVDPSLFYDVSESVSYDLDLFGKLRRTIEKDKASVEQQQASLDLMRVNTAAQVAQAYSGVCAAGLEIAVTRRSIDTAEKLLYYTRRRYQAGLTSRTDVVQAEQSLFQTQSQLPAKITDQRTDLFMLATLTGDVPEAIPEAVLGCARPPVLRTPIPTGNGAGLLARRPDVRQAERKVAGDVANIGVKTAALYPDVSLTGSLGDLRTSIAGFVINYFSYSVGSMISWTFPNRSGTRAQIAQASATARADLASFDNTVLGALKDTESALVTLSEQLETERLDTLSRDDAALAYDDTRRKYAAGVGSFSDVLNAEKTLVMAENTLASATADVSKDQVKLFMQLGGGWQDAPPVAETPLDAVAVKRH